MNLLDKVKAAGVVGAGGAGFPTHVKLNSQAEFIIMNGAECEPLLRVDQQLMEIYPDEIIKGFEISGRQVNATKGIIGIKKKHKKVIGILNERIKALSLDGYIEVGELPDMYPAGDEQVLVYELTGRVVPELGIPLNVGCVVMNSETALNVYYANENVPVTQKYITLAGDIPERKTVKVPVGTPIIDVLKMSKIDDFSEYAIVDGGPMMGPMLNGTSGYVSKKTKGFVILKKDHHLVRKKSISKEQARRINKATCEQCRLCSDLCPRNLLGHAIEPHKMMRAMIYNTGDIEGQKISQLCCECNLCELFSCPAGLAPKMANKHFKEELMAQKIKYAPTKQHFEPKKSREFRKIPSKRLVIRLGLKKYDLPAPMVTETLVPQIVRILTRQHVGAPAVPCVVEGQSVIEGQIIGNIPAESLGAAIHSSINGIVSEITDNYIEIRR